MFEQYPDEIDTILLDTSICLGTIKSKAIANNIVDGNSPIQERPRIDLQELNRYWGINSYKQYFNEKRKNFPERYSKYSNEFYSRMESAPKFTVDFFLDLQSDIRDLSIEELKILRESVERVPDIIKTFMPQDEILKRMRTEDSINREMGGFPPYHRIAQVRFIGKLSQDTSSAINYQILQNRKLHDIARKVILDLGKFGFRFPYQISYPHDYPYTNWIENIPDIMLNYYNCYIDMINRLIDLERLQEEMLERERLERERSEKDRLEKDRLEKDRLERERSEKDRLERERSEKDRLEKDRLEKDRLERERLEKDRLERERLEKDRLERERLEKDRLERERSERERLERERLEKNCPSKNMVPKVCETKKDFFKQSLIFHPDKNSGCYEEATEKFKLLQNKCSSVRGGQSKLKRKIKTKKRKIRITKKQKITFKKKQKYKKSNRINR